MSLKLAMLIRKQWRVLFALMLLLFPCLTFGATLRITGLHITTSPEKTHLVFDLSNTGNYRVFSLANPDRLVIDFSDARLRTSLRGNFNKTSVVDIRSGYPVPGTLRIVIDLRRPLRHTAELQKGNGNKASLIIDLYEPGYRPTAKPAKKEQKPKPAGSSAQTPNQSPAAPAVSNKQPNSTAAQPSATTANAASSGQMNSLPPGKSTDDNAVEQDMLQQVLAKQTPSDQQPAATKSTTAATATKTATTPLPIPPASTATTTTAANSLPAPIATASSQRVINVVIDPGHGGKDPGTTGHFGVREKDVVLAIGTNLNQLLQKDPRFRVFNTRGGDNFLTLRQRLAVARKNRGDVFIAIHADAFKDPFATGASIYALSPHGASSEAALWLAKKENYSELGGIKLTDKSDLLRSVLIDLSQTATVASSLKLGQDLLDELGKVGKLHHSTVEQAPFMVLKSPDIPSVLIETGFLSNPSEEERLRNPIYQQQIAQAIYNGLLDYFTTNPAAGKQIVSAQK